MTYRLIIVFISTVWQHPFVNIFKQLKVDEWKKSSKEGDVTKVMDKALKSSVFKIQGEAKVLIWIYFDFLVKNKGSLFYAIAECVLEWETLRTRA